eukprot:752259-Hanusia_phi.AAC.2
MTGIDEVTQMRMLAKTPHVIGERETIMATLKSECFMTVGTPGRLLYMLQVTLISTRMMSENGEYDGERCLAVALLNIGLQNMKGFNLRNIKYLVLDEVNT